MTVQAERRRAATVQSGNHSGRRTVLPRRRPMPLPAPEHPVPVAEFSVDSQARPAPKPRNALPTPIRSPLPGRNPTRRHDRAALCLARLNFVERSRVGHGLYCPGTAANAAELRLTGGRWAHAPRYSAEVAKVSIARSAISATANVSSCSNRATSMSNTIARCGFITIRNGFPCVPPARRNNVRNPVSAARPSSSKMKPATALLAFHAVTASERPLARETIQANDAISAQKQAAAARLTPLLSVMKSNNG